jgi:hypothetical protein
MADGELFKQLDEWGLEREVFLFQPINQLRHTLALEMVWSKFKQ